MSALARAPESWAGLADDLARQGNFREAVRHLYLALLSRLHRTHAIDYDITASNWEYVSRFRGQSIHKPAFRQLTNRFDFTWYGNEITDAELWNQFRSTAQPLIQPEVAE
jgi:hypothetical protein